MRKTKLSLIVALAMSLLSSPSLLADNQQTTDIEHLRKIFVSPADSVQTSVYWYWLSGNVTVDGVQKDLEAMKRAGINRAFIGNIGLGDLHTPFKTIELFTPEWWEVMHAALKKASELDIEIGIFNCPGWSQAGGPWIAPSQAMRYLTASVTDIEGGAGKPVILPRPEGDFQDVRVIAYPATAGIALRKAPLAGENKISFDLPEGYTFRSLKLMPVHRDMRADVTVTHRSKDGSSRVLATVPVDRSNPNVEVGFDPYATVAVSLPVTSGGCIDVEISGLTEGAGFSEIEISETPVVERYPEKSLAKMYQTPLPYWHEYQWRVQPYAADTSHAVNPADIIDITDCLHGDTLQWDAPAGRWTVMRTGMLPTGIENGPAAPEGTGHEVDKLTDAYLQHHFDAFIGEILRRIPPEDRRTFRVIVADSYEKGGQNFSDNFRSDFAARFGYDPLPYYPVYQGVVVGNRDMSDRFLWDMRRFVADRLAYAHIGGMREKAHAHGLTLWLENYGHWGFPGEFLQYGGQSDEVSGEFWSEGTLGDIENRAASSAAHIYGKKKVSAESFTAAGNDFFRHPAIMKPRGDRFFSEGINNTLLHVYISQPDDRRPGMNAWFGNEFNRNNTWFSHFDLFSAYLKRCNLMLQQGNNVADVAYFIGEDAPKMTGITDPALPAGYQFDYINAEVIMNRLSVKDGRWTLPDGTSYALLVLPKLETMRPGLLERLSTLVADGGVLLGPAPHRSPSLQNYPQADSTVRSIAARLWDGTQKKHSYGKGTVLSDMSIEEAAEIIGLVPDFSVPAGTPVLYGHRDAGDKQIYFITNQSDGHIEFDASLRVSGLYPWLWMPDGGAVRPLAQYTDNGTRTSVPVALEPNESIFIVFSPDNADAWLKQAKVTENFPAATTLPALDGNTWTITFEEGMRGPSRPIKATVPFNLAESENDSIRYFSGQVDYETTFNLSKKDLSDGSIYINTGKVGAMARIFVNGKYAGGVWTAPYRTDITPYVKKGKNTLRIELVTTWVNRLIGDSRLPENERLTWALQHPWNADSPLQPSGLLEPVKIEKLPL